ncbi:Cu(I)-responsive transcriptional regulator [Sulfitobacter sp. S190]|uniref:Cu(I)-responsive transcriptional regulator n=1 Tax=Sulfitobacter sp. S190 TaxID=2867022 RepID=UPI0021A6EFE0|nr:Cu(I)-responsive transcriptional regulator [Sulfitobacter sp. S190]UWR22432.1 Cu(I)-responsive transcriptional regulator [Sulfitobacter sp. S190]
MNISEVEQQTGLPAKTIRYYEDIELVTPHRQSNGYRAFSPSDVHQLTFIARARSLGFSVEECRSLLALYNDRDRASADVKALAQAHLSDIDRKIAELQDMRNTLARLVVACAGDDRPDCPILGALGKA